MPIYDSREQTLLAGLSSFWRDMFGDKDVLNRLYAATEEMLAQAYQDILYDILGNSLETVPVWRQSYWHYITLRQDLVTYHDGEEFPYRVQLEGENDLRVVQILYAQLVDPQTILEDGVQYSFNRTDATISFVEDPIANLKEPARRRVSRVPRVYKQGEHAVALSSTQVQIYEVLQRGDDGVLSGTTDFQAPSATFTAEHVGMTLTTQGTPAEVTIEQVINEKNIVVSSAVTGPATTLWTIQDREHFTTYDEGRYLRITDPNDPNTKYTYKIDQVVDAATVDLVEEIEWWSSATQKLGWEFVSRSDLVEIALWCPNALWDHYDIAHRYGALIERFEASTPEYKALVKGIFHYYQRGPSLDRIEASLDLLVGVPVIETNGEIVRRIVRTSLGDTLVTDRRSYEVPAGSLVDDLEIGQELQAFQSITKIFSVNDRISDPDWFHGVTIPRELIVDSTVPDRIADPDMYPTTIGSTSKPWFVGQPNTLVGGDERGATSSSVLEASEGLVGSSGQLVSEDIKLPGIAVGKQVEVWSGKRHANSTFHEILNIQMDSTNERTEATLDPALTTLSISGTIDYDDEILTVTTSSWEWNTEDVGRIIKFTASSLVGLANSRWRISEVLDKKRVRIRSWTQGISAVTFSSGNTFSAEVGYNWRLKLRQGMHHNLGYQVMRTELLDNTAYVQFDALSYPDIPFPKSQKDIKDILFEGKPSHVYLLFESGGDLKDEFTVVEDVTLAPIVFDTLVAEDAKLKVGGGWKVGDHYTWSGTETAWWGMVREHDAASIVELQDAPKADDIVLSLYIEGGDGSANVEVYAWNGSSWALHSTQSLDTTGTNLAVIDNAAGLRMAVKIGTVTGTFDTSGLAYGYRSDDPSVLTRSQDTSYMSNTGAINAPEYEYLSDANYTFYPFDVGRVIYIQQGTQDEAYIVDGVLTTQKVALRSYPSGATAELDAGVGVSWRWGAPLQYFTPVVVGMEDFDVSRSGSPDDEHVVDWPVLVRRVYTPRVWMPVSFGLEATGTVS